MTAVTVATSKNAQFTSAQASTFTSVTAAESHEVVLTIGQWPYVGALIIVTGDRSGLTNPVLSFEIEAHPDQGYTDAGVTLDIAGVADVLSWYHPGEYPQLALARNVRLRYVADAGLGFFDIAVSTK